MPDQTHNDSINLSKTLKHFNWDTCNKVGSISPTKHLVGFEPGTFLPFQHQNWPSCSEGYFFSCKTINIIYMKLFDFFSCAEVKTKSLERTQSYMEASIWTQDYRRKMTRFLKQEFLIVFSVQCILRFYLLSSFIVPNYKKSF